jgi:hypothetical protein
MLEILLLKKLADMTEEGTVRVGPQILILIMWNVLSYLFTFTTPPVGPNKG